MCCEVRMWTKSKLLHAQSPLRLPRDVIEKVFEAKRSPAEAKDERVSVAGEIEKTVETVR